MSRLVYYAEKQKRDQGNHLENMKSLGLKLNSCLFEICILPAAWESCNDETIDCENN